MEPITFILAFIIGATVVSYNQTDRAFHLPSEQTLKAWSHTTLPPAELSSLIGDDFCQENEKHFLACASALDNIGKYLRVNITPTGKIAISFYEDYSQKTRLKSWEKFYKKHPKEAKKISFQKIFEEKIIKKTDPKYHSLLTAAGINGYLTVKFDPHTYIEPLKLSEIPPPFISPTPTLPLPIVVPTSPLDEEIEDLEEGEDTEQVVRVMINKRLDEPSLLTIDRFNDDVCNQTKKALKEVIEAQVSKLIIDLKDNRGGLVEQVVCVAGLFLDKKKIVELKYFQNKQPKEVLYSRESQMYAGELTVFINESSASASEILAGALQFYKRAQLVGKRTFGKGTFQQPTTSPYYKYNLKFMETKGFFYLPNGQSPQLKGLNPDKEDESIESALREEVFYLFPLEAEPLD